MRLVRSVFAGLALVGAACLSGCGFTPLYGENGVAARLADFDIETGSERVDFLLQEALLDEFGARHGDGRFVLVTETEIEEDRLGVGADDVASRYSLELVVRYGVRRAGSTEMLMTGRTRNVASYDVPREVYAAIRARNDAEARAAEQAAERIARDLARAILRFENE